MNHKLKEWWIFQCLLGRNFSQCKMRLIMSVRIQLQFYMRGIKILVLWYNFGKC